MAEEQQKKHGFTLMEISIVFTIIALIAGGVVVGRELLQVAMVRAQVSQLQEVFLGIGTFRAKYKYLPGDVPAAQALKYGFLARETAMYGLGDNLLQGYYGTGAMRGYAQSGEPVVFWSDLARAKLMKPLAVEVAKRAGPTTLVPSTKAYSDGTSLTFAIKDILPKAASGNGGFMYIWSGGTDLRFDNSRHNGKHYLGIAGITEITGTEDDTRNTNMSMTAATAFQLDSKIDDGLPQSGIITAIYPDRMPAPFDTHMIFWAHGNRQNGANSGSTWPERSPTTAATPATEHTCYDNNNTVGVMNYSTRTNSGNLNCALSIEITQ